tara:strand:- start:588 stop:1022 length:435 start_codon:yes stop_codon:yes gene_type:complete
MSDLKFALTMTRSVEYTHSFEMNEKHAENAIAKYGSMLEYKQSKNDLNRALFGNRARTHETEPDSYNDSEWKRRIYPDEWTSTVIEDEPKSYEVTIRGEIEKTISVEAIDAYEAELEARHIFETKSYPNSSAAAGEMLKIEVVV